MRVIKYTSQFKKDYKRLSKSSRYKSLDTGVLTIVKQLAQDSALAHKHRDHALAGEWKDHRDCHIKPDLILIYRKPDKAALELVRIGSHSQLSL